MKIEEKNEWKNLALPITIKKITLLIMLWRRLKLFCLYEDLGLDEGGGLPLFQKLERAPIQEQQATTITAQQGMWKLNYPECTSSILFSCTHYRSESTHSDFFSLVYGINARHFYLKHSSAQVLEALIK